MKVICVGYYDKFSRFFIGVQKALKQHGVIADFHILSIHFSGFLYTWLRRTSGFWLPLRAWRNAQEQRQKYLEICRTQHNYHGIAFNSFIKFHQALNTSFSEENLQLQALSYIDLYIDLFETNKPDYVLLVGDSRMAVETCVAVAKKYGIPIFYVEQGPFSTTIFDTDGVNANAYFRKHIAQLMAKPIEIAPLNWLHFTTKKYKRSPFYRIGDFVIDHVQRKKNSFPPDLLETDVNNLKNRFKKQNSTPAKSNGQPLFLLIFQVPIDVNMIYHSPYFSSHLELLTTVYKNMPKDCQLVVREHPVYLGMYQAEIYDYISKNNIILDNHSTLSEALSNAEVVIVNNSTVGIEAISNYKKLVVLGNAFYDYEGVCLKYEGDNLKQLLEKALHLNLNITDFQKFLTIFKNTCLLEGTITDQDLTSAKMVAQKLIKHSKTNV